MATLTKSEIAAMSPEERLGLIDDIWCSFKDDPESLPSPEWHWDVIRARLDAQQQSPKPTQSWEAVRAEMEEKWLA
jgi:putative addiction module component (TIGR02574 family)